MTTDKALNDKIINVVKDRIPKNANLSSVLKDVLYIGMEAIYRRIRGEVPFSFAEVLRICQEFSISMDSLFNPTGTEKAVFNLNVLPMEDSTSAYLDLLENYTQNVQKLKEFSNNYCLTAINLIPQLFYFNLEFVPKFTLFKWVYLMNRNPVPLPFSQLESPIEIKAATKKLTSELLSISKTTILVSPLVFKTFINDIHYFVRLNLITKEELSGFKKELLMLVDEIEYATIYGKFKNANESELYIYLSNVNFEATYTYYGSENFEFTHVRLYTANSIRSENPVVCRLHKEWIRSLMKASTLITQSGEVTRYKFLEEQRRIIKEM